MTWVPQQLYYFRPAPAGVWTVCYHHNQWNGSGAGKFRNDLEQYASNIVSLDAILDGGAPPESKWSAWLCTSPRLSRFLIRLELKLWSWWIAGRRCLPFRFRRRRRRLLSDRTQRSILVFRGVLATAFLGLTPARMFGE